MRAYWMAAPLPLRENGNDDLPQNDDAVSDAEHVLAFRGAASLTLNSRRWAGNAQYAAAATRHGNRHAQALNARRHNISHTATPDAECTPHFNES